MEDTGCIFETECTDIKQLNAASLFLSSKKKFGMFSFSKYAELIAPTT